MCKPKGNYPQRKCFCLNLIDLKLAFFSFDGFILVYWENLHSKTHTVCVCVYLGIAILPGKYSPRSSWIHICLRDQNHSEGAVQGSQGKAILVWQEWCLFIKSPFRTVLGMCTGGWSHDACGSQRSILCSESGLVKPWSRLPFRFRF